MADRDNENLHMNKWNKDQWELVIPFIPSSTLFGDNANDDVQSLVLKLHTANLPGLSMPDLQIPIGNGVPVQDFEAETIYEPLILTFYIDDNFHNYNLMLFWLLAKNHPEFLGGLIPTKLDLFVDMTLNILAANRDIKMSYNFRECHIQSLSETELDFEGQHHLSTATFVYDFFLPNTDFVKKSTRRTLADVNLDILDRDSVNLAPDDC